MSASRLGAGLTAAGCVLVVAAAVALHAAWLLPNHDNAWYLIAAERMLAGGDYMTDFADPNPPLIMLLNMPPVLLARMTGLDGYACFSAYVGALILLSLGLAARPLAACLTPNAGFSGVAVIAAAVILAMVPGYEYGQREHLFAILFLPFLFWSAARAAGELPRFGIGGGVICLLGALGSLIKPFYLLVPLALLGLRLSGPERGRVLRDPAVAVFVAVVLLYGIFVLLAFPGFLAAAALQASVYAAWNRAWVSVLDAARDAVAPLFLLLALAILAPVRPALRGTLWHCVAAAAVCLLLGLLQKKGFLYQLLPTLQFAQFGLAGLTAALLTRLRGGLRMAMPAVGLLASIGGASAMTLVRPYGELASFTRARYAQDPLLTALRETARGQPVLLLTGGFLMGFPDLAEVRLGASAPGQVLLPGTVLLSQGGPAERARAAVLRPRVVEQLVNDLARFHPAIVAVDRRRLKQALPDDFDVLAFYADDVRFRQAWSEYRLLRSVPGWDLYRRGPSAD